MLIKLVGRNTDGNLSSYTIQAFNIIFVLCIFEFPKLQPLDFVGHRLEKITQLE